jgi:hypothetical protein
MNTKQGVLSQEERLEFLFEPILGTFNWLVEV